MPAVNNTDTDYEKCLEPVKVSVGDEAESKGNDDEIPSGLKESFDSTVVVKEVSAKTGKSGDESDRTTVWPVEERALGLEICRCAVDGSTKVGAKDDDVRHTVKKHAAGLITGDCTVGSSLEVGSFDVVICVC